MRYLHRNWNWFAVFQFYLWNDTLLFQSLRVLTWNSVIHWKLIFPYFENVPWSLVLSDKCLLVIFRQTLGTSKIEQTSHCLLPHWKGSVPIITWLEPLVVLQSIQLDSRLPGYTSYCCNTAPTATLKSHPWFSNSLALTLDKIIFLPEHNFPVFSTDTLNY